MRNVLFIGSHGLFLAGLGALGGLLGCGDGIHRHGATENDRGDEPEIALARAREAGADVYAPALYGATVDALERGETEEGTLRAETLACRAADEATRVRDEAKLAAESSLRDAEVLLSVVEAVPENKGAGGEGLPSDARVAELRAELGRASQAYEAGDFAVAGLLAQTAVAGLREPASRSGDGR